VNLRPRRPHEPDINLTPLIDVVFLLLIFFMVSTTFDEDARLRIELPEAEGEAAGAQEPEQVEIVIDRTGRHWVDDARVLDRDIETLKQALVGAVGPRRDLPVLIKADARTPHEAVMRALDAASQLGLTQVVFAADRPDTVE